MDELERRIRAARPLSGHRNLPLTDRAKRELADLILADTLRTDSRRAAKRRSTARMLIAGIAVLATLVAGVFTANAFLTPQSVYAATLPPLHAVADSGATEGLLTQMSRNLKNDDPEGSPQHFTINVQAWTLATDDSGIATSSTIVPEDYQFTRNMDGSFATVVTYGKALDRDGHPATGTDLPHPGEVSWQETWLPGEYMFLFPEPAPEDPAAVGAFLGTVSGMATPADASATIQAVANLLFEQQLNPHQLAALLTYLAGLPDLRVAGEVTDRIGRSGILFTAESTDRPGYEDHLIIGTDSGKILATETVYRGADRTDIASPSVINYYIWR